MQNRAEIINNILNPYQMTKDRVSYLIDSVEERNKLSVILEPYYKLAASENQSLIYKNFLGERFSVDYGSGNQGRLYYGLHPSIDSYEIRKLKENGVIDNADKLEQYIIDNANKFLMYEKYENEFIRACFKITLINVARLSQESYNGVFLRIVKITPKQKVEGSKNIYLMKMFFELTTYFTTNTFDNFSKLIKHNQLNDDERKILEANYQSEYNLHMTLHKEIQDGVTNLENINKFLSQAFHTNHVGVSANIATKDGYVILAKRSAKNDYDQEKIICSANGNCEAADNNVLYYKYSVFEDLPAINIDSKINRMDLIGEAIREINAEIGVEVTSNCSSCEGISVTSEISDSKMIFHFNVLYSFNTINDYRACMKKSEFATEKWENEKFYGLRVEKHKHKLSKKLYWIPKLLKGLFDSKYLIMSLITVAALVMPPLFSKKASLDLQTILTLFFFILWIILSSIKIYKLYKDHKKYSNNMKIFNVLDKNTNDMLKEATIKFTVFFKKNNKGILPNTYIMFLLDLTKNKV